MSTPVHAVATSPISFGSWAFVEEQQRYLFAKQQETTKGKRPSTWLIITK